MPVILFTLFWLVVLFFAASQPEPPPERQCVDGVEYFVPYGTNTPTTAVIDASTKAPKLCEVKNVPVQ